MLFLTNTLTRHKESFTPLDPSHVRMYVCGPTVYDHPHIGNARAVVVYDVLYRLLQQLFPKVTYVRNITDVDDKINAAAKNNREPIQALTSRITRIFHEDMAALGNLSPTLEPKATEHIGEMITMIEQLIALNHAYVSQGHVYFSVRTYPAYGRLSGREQEDMVAGARVEISALKKDPADFVLWKPAAPGDDVSAMFDSPWGKGRPGWHIECSAMSVKYLGVDFDIHGGGADLMFPHHTNEIAQSCCSHPGSHFAHTWVHNGFLTVNGEKMSKSLGNFITVRELLNKGVKGEVIRYVLLSTHYRKPLDWNEKALQDAQKALDGFYRALEKAPEVTANSTPEAFLTLLGDDLNTPELLAKMHDIAKTLHKTAILSEIQEYGSALYAAGTLLGLFGSTPQEWFQEGANTDNNTTIEALIEARKAAKKARNFAEADKIRQELSAQGIVLEDKPDGSTSWRRS